ncbi:MULTISPECIES: hypothetical protein [unclassified Micromonospora]|uniref:hypothetical protein n=1 Tax=unclassified Micromonospora TaxID=2617518 RepID=UPI00259D0786|nr:MULTISPECIES: hypothetical protein [unclassified Micromonospora]MDM4780918.1 hypothetical protein [Micromonospora sp. b486]
MDDLERELRELTGWLEPARTPDVTARVRARLDTPAPRRRWRYVLAAALAGAVTGLLRFSGIVMDTAPAPPPTGTPSPLPAQHQVALAEAQRQVRFPIRVPARLGVPERVLVADPDGAGAHRVVSLLHRGGTVRLDAFDGWPGPSIVDLPAAGCWRLRLDWSGRTDMIDLVYRPASG